MTGNISWETYRKEAMRNLSLMSRTANGIVSVATAKGKEEDMLVGSDPETRGLANRNYERAMRQAYEALDREFSSPKELEDFIRELVCIINDGIVKPECFFRTREISRHLPVAELPAHFSWFCGQLYERFGAGRANPWETACFIEFQIDALAHFFADGCGKVSKLLSSCALMRAGEHLPAYKGRDEYYAVWDSLPYPRRDPRFYHGFWAYYQTLIPMSSSSVKPRSD